MVVLNQNNIIIKVRCYKLQDENIVYWMSISSILWYIRRNYLVGNEARKYKTRLVDTILPKCFIFMRIFLSSPSPSNIWHIDTKKRLK